MLAIFAFVFSDSSVLHHHSIAVVATEYTLFRAFVKLLLLFDFFSLL